ncbi:MAG: DUF1565 domain-containing protein [Kiritimatiellae bacterium]|nr:DUF1565 domain-containing protein [Kiritimatiellia bacterium]
MRHLTFAMLAAACCGVAMSAGAATYFVVPGGNDADPGTESQPWRTLQKAADSVQPGDTVRIRAGDYPVGKSWDVRRAGTDTAPIAYRAYGDGPVRITNARVIPASAWKRLRDDIYYAELSDKVDGVFQNDIPLHGPQGRVGIKSEADLIPNSFFARDDRVYVRLEDGSDPKRSVMRTSPGHTVQLFGCHYTIFEGLTVEFGGRNAFKAQGGNAHHVTYRGNTIRSVRSQGIQGVPPYAIIEGNLFQKIGCNRWDHGIYTATPGVTIRHNVFEEIAGAAIHLFKEGATGAGGYEIYGNVCRKPRKVTYPTTGNRCYTDMIIWEEGGNRIYNNVFYGEGKRTSIDLNSPNNLVYNNTFVDGAPAIRFRSEWGIQPHNRVFNNLFHNSAGSFMAWPANALPQRLDHNLYHAAGANPSWQHDGMTYTRFSEYRAAAGEAESIYADPKLVSQTDPRPRPGSPAIDKGAALPEVRADIEGVARPQGAGWDIGAYEVSARVP